MNLYGSRSSGFDMVACGLQVASARLGLGVTTLKRVCRASNMKRWPFRKRNSLGRLIDRTKQVLDDGTGQDNMQKLAALQVLEKQRQVMRVRVSPLCSCLWVVAALDVDACHLQLSGGSSV